MSTIKRALNFLQATLLTIILVSFSSCNQSKITVDGLVEKSGGTTGPTITVSNVDVVADQLVINGTNLETATSIRVTGPAGFDETFDIESKVTNQIIANSQSNLTMIVNGLFSLIVSNAYGAATYTITFELQDGQVTAAKLSGMGAAAGDVLTYDGSSWGPAPLTGLSYEGTFDATSATDQTGATPASGHYYIVQNAGSIDPDGVTRSNTYSVGDWAVYNGSTSTWDRVVGSSDVTSVNGQTGVVTLDWSDFSKAGSLLSDIANVDVSGRNTGDILVWNGSNWVVQAAPTDTNTNASTICGASQVLLGDGSCSALPSDTNAASLCAAGEYLDGDGTCKTAAVNTNAGTLCAAGEYLDGDGTCKTVPTDTDTDTNAGTLCAAGEYLDGDGTCKTAATTVTSLGVDTITSGAGLYFTYQPNNVACADGEVLKWDNSNSRWDCGTDNGGAAADATQLRGEDLDPALATNTTTDGQILVWSQTNSRWEVGAAPTDNDTTYSAGTGLGLSGTTFNVDVGTGANQIVQLDGSGNLPAVDGSALTNITAGSVNVDDVNNGAGLYFGYQPNNAACTNGQVLEWNGAQGWICGNKTVDTDTDTTYSAGTGLGLSGTTFNVDVGTGANQIVQLDGSGNLPALDGSALTNVAAATAATAESVNVDDIANGAGLYFTYQPNNAACSDGQVLKWSTSNSRWECGSDAGAGGGDAASLRGEALDTSLATNTTTDGQILVWSQTNSRWEVGAAPTDTDTTYSAGTGLGLSGTTFNVDAGTGANQIVQLDGSGNLPAVDGSALTNVAATTAASVNVDDVANGAGLYFGYQPNNAACTNGQVLEWNGAQGWICGTKTVDTNTNAATLCSAGEYLDGDGTCQTVPSGADNLGDHTATTNIQLNGNWLSNDGGSEGLGVDNDGNVGVGTLSPSAKLDVSGTGNPELIVQTTATASSTAFMTLRGARTADGAAIGDIQFESNDGAGLAGSFGANRDGSARWDGARLGVGQASFPQSVFHTYSDNSTNLWSNTISGSLTYNPFPHEMYIENNAVGTDGSYAGILLKAGSTDGSNQINTARIAAIRDGGFKTDLAFATRASGGSMETRLFIDGDGDVGVGTASPTEKLTVDGNINVTTGNDICIDGAGCLSSAVSGGGETNTASNLGTGANVFESKSGVDLQFRSIASSDSSVTVTQNANDIDLAVSVAVDELTNGAGLYFGYQPNNSACSDGEVLEWLGASGWVCGTKTVDTNTTYTAGNGIDATAFAGNEIALDLTAGTALSLNGVSGALQSEWLLSGTDLSYSAGNVGIGTATPSHDLTVFGTPGDPATSGSTQPSTLRLRSDSSLVAFDFGIDDTAPWTTWIQNSRSTDLSVTHPIALNPSGGGVAVGTMNPDNFIHFLNETTSNDVIHESINDSANSGSDYIFRRARGTAASISAVQNGDKLGGLRYRGWDGTAYETGAQIEAFVEGTVADEQMATSLTFQTRDASNSNAQERMRISPEGRVGIGTDDPTAIFTIAGANEDIHHYSHASSSSGAPDLKFYRSRGNASSPAAVQDGDWLGSIRARGYDGDEYLFTSAMYIKADGTVSNNTIPTRFEFHTHSTTANDSREVMRIDSAGDVTMEGHLLLREVAAPTQTANYGKLYVKTDNKLYFLDDAGTEHDLVNPSGASVTGISSSADATAITIDANERVGINTPSPSESLEVTGTVKATAGTVWSSDGSTGTSRGLIVENYDDSANQNGVDIAAKLGGSEFQGLSWTQDTAWTSGSSAADKDASMSFGVLKDNVATTAMTLSSDGYLGIGTNSPSSNLHIVGADGANAEIKMGRYSSDINGANLLLSKARGTRASPSAVQLGDQLGRLRMSGYNGTDFDVFSVNIQGIVAGVPAGNGNIPSDLNFRLTNSGGSRVDAMYIQGTTGNVGIGTTTPEEKLHVGGGNIILDNTQALRFNLAGGGEANAIQVGTGDNLTLGNPGLDDVTIDVGTLGEAVRVKETTGFVGIGTSDPLTQLSVNADNAGEAISGTTINIAQGGTGDSTLSWVLSGTRRWFAGIDNSDEDKWKLATTSGVPDFDTNAALTVDTSGNVGIGSTNPDGKLVIAKDDSSLPGHLVLEQTGTNAGPPVLSFRKTRSEASAVLEGDSLARLDTISHLGGGSYDHSEFMRVEASENHGVGSAGTEIHFRTIENGSTGDGTSMMIANNGDVGIGTGPSDPLGRLDVSLDGAGTIARFHRQDLSQPYVRISGVGDKAAIGFGDADSADIPWAIGMNASKFQIRYGQDDLNGGTNAMTIDNSGQVGIGLANPSNALDVVGKIVSTGSMVSGASTGSVALTTNDGGGNANLTFNHENEVPDQDGVSGRITVNVDGTTANAYMDFELDHSLTAGVSTSLTNIMRLRKNGTAVEVGIGTANPDQMLSVNGNASKASGGTSWAVFSDERLKTVNGKFDRGLASVRELEPIFFQYNEDNPLGIAHEEEQIGFVAQEVQKVIPEAVTLMDSGYLQLNADPILWTMLNSIKELDLLFGEETNKNIEMFERMAGLEAQVQENTREIASLREENEELKARVESLEERLERLEKLFLKK